MEANNVGVGAAQKTVHARRRRVVDWYGIQQLSVVEGETINNVLL